MLLSRHAARNSLRRSFDTDDAVVNRQRHEHAPERTLERYIPGLCRAWVPHAFQPKLGYVDIRDSRIVDHKHNWCRHHKEPKAMVAVRSGQPVWQCFHANCLSRTNLLGETITVGNIVFAAHPKHGRFRVWSIGEDGFAILQMVGNQGDGDFVMDFWEEIPIDSLSPVTLTTAAE